MFIAIKTGYGKKKTAYAISDYKKIKKSGYVKDMTDLYNILTSNKIDEVFIEDTYFTEYNTDTAKVLARITGKLEAVAELLDKPVKFVTPGEWRSGYNGIREIAASGVVGKTIKELNLACAILIAYYLSGSPGKDK